MPPPPADHAARLERARLALEGLSLGDAFGQCFFTNPALVEGLIAARAVPAPPWPYTDDTVMALSVYEVLAETGRLDQDRLALAFARRYVEEPRRGYGGGAHTLLRQLAEGEPWQRAAPALFEGQGSFGNGGAMRVAPLGAYFADDLGALVEAARASAEVTHAHPDGQAGAVAVAAAAAFACSRRGAGGRELLAFAHAHTPPGATRDGIGHAAGLPEGCSVRLAASALGSGALVSSADTVPFSLWCAARCLDDFEGALWLTVAGLGDRDTTCAIVGGIVALSVGRDALPTDWLAAREPLPPGP
ncbi:MAG TPA: ADP-ribosylglycohydrolase family protein [Polyangiaceae bacterium]|nr:ADP-ribosylglycohydrolase family protein [Polyangiaceae bacterium]